MIDQNNIANTFIEQIKALNQKFEKFNGLKIHASAIDKIIIERTQLVGAHNELLLYSQKNMPKWVIFSNLKNFMKELQSMLKRFTIPNLYLFDIHTKNQEIQKMLLEIQNINKEREELNKELYYLKQATNLGHLELNLLHALQVKCENLEKDKVGLIEKYNQSLSQCKTLLSENKILRENCDTLNEENINLLKVINTLEVNYDAIQKQYVTLQHKYTQLETQLQGIPLQDQTALNNFYAKITEHVLRTVEQKQRNSIQIQNLGLNLNDADKQCRIN